jgi:formyl-CoA transferase
MKPCLDGIRVLELGSSIAGPAAAAHLAAFGADVIKVEPHAGDQLRSWGTPAPDGTSWWFKSLNRNKRFVAYDVRKADEAAEVRRIALSCDVIVENFRPGWLASFGLDAATLRAQKPSLIYVSISGYGQDGPFAQRPGFGSIAESIGGFRHITGEPSGPPMRLGISIVRARWSYRGTGRQPISRDRAERRVPYGRQPLDRARRKQSADLRTPHGGDG